MGEALNKDAMKRNWLIIAAMFVICALLFILQNVFMMGWRALVIVIPLALLCERLLLPRRL